MNSERQEEPAEVSKAAPVFVGVVLVEEKPRRNRQGDVCPRCGKARLDYDGLLNLSCPVCHFMEGGCFT
ncbi:MAG TPA: hypothetical protein PJ988_08620 [Anaerolinea sp.]|nr:hypothetical protein [Anaerolinea sp.]